MTTKSRLSLEATNSRERGPLDSAEFRVKFASDRRLEMLNLSSDAHRTQHTDFKYQNRSA
jgi:hypothetical protein